MLQLSDGFVVTIFAHIKISETAYCNEVPPPRLCILSQGVVFQAEYISDTMPFSENMLP